MPDSSPHILYDVAIVGAGPAGTTCALALRESGLKVALIDQAIFPRDKVCGDAIPARCAHVLRALDPAFVADLERFSDKVSIGGCRVVAPNGNLFDYRFHTPGYCSKRLDFDHFLLDLATDAGGFDLYSGKKVSRISGVADHWVLERGIEKDSVRARLIVGCDGANGISARTLAQTSRDLNHHCAAVRAYYSGIADLQSDMLEIHFPEAFLPGYFWIFPLNNGFANVGFGMLSSKLSGRKMNLRKALPELIASDDRLRARFAGATLHGDIQGFGLPMGSRKVAMSGNGFLLCGDAASLIEPATGEGIGNAMLSASIAADWVIKAFAANRLDADFLKSYDDAVYGRIWRDLRNKYRAQKFLGERKWLMNWLVNRANKPGLVRALMKRVF